MQIFEFKNVSNISHELSSSRLFQRLPEIIKQSCLFAQLSVDITNTCELSVHNQHPNEDTNLSSTSKQLRFLIIFAEQIKHLGENISEQIAYYMCEDELALVSLECIVLNSRQQDLGNINLAGSITFRSNDNPQVSALVHSWIHAQNNLMSTISGYTELLTMDSDEPMLKEILSRCQQIALFNEKNAIFSCDKPGQSDATWSDRARVLADVSRSLEHYFEFEDIKHWQLEKLKIDKINRVVYRWIVREDVSIKSWDIASIYQAIGHQCHYLLKFELMRMSYNLRQFGAVIRTIKNPQSQQTIIEVVMPISANDLPIPYSKLCIIPVSEQSDNNTVTELSQLFCSLGIMCRAVPFKTLNSSDKVDQYRDCEVLREATANEYIQVVNLL
jgi:hypothetical protein